MTASPGEGLSLTAARATSPWLIALLVAAGLTGCGSQPPSPATGLPAAETGATSSPLPIDATTSPGQDSAGLLVVTAQGRSREQVLSAIAAQQGRIVKEVPQTGTYLVDVVPERRQAALRAFIDAGLGAMPLPGGNPIGTGGPDSPR